MSRCRFNYDFFQDGYSDVLAEVRALRASGLWTKEKRTQWTKQAVSTHQRLKHSRPFLPEGVSYYAGRVSALKSRRTTHFSEKAERKVRTECPTILRLTIKS